MAGIVVCGGGVGGLLTALLLAGDGHEVTVLERDPAPPPAPDDAWDGWERRGVNQFRLPHFLMPAFHALACAELPALVPALEAAGAYRLNMLVTQSGGMAPPAPPYEAVTARRPVLESVVATLAEGTPGVTVRRGDAVRALLTGASAVAGVPHVVGVETEGGARLLADLVVDATGRRSPLPRLLTAIGARPPFEEKEEAGVVYYGRHVAGAAVQERFPGPTNVRCGSVSLLALPGDNGTAGIGVLASSLDVAMRPLRHEQPWQRVVRMLPGGDVLLDAEPISPLVSMTGLEDRRRRYTVDGVPVATGVVAVGDSWAATNPSLGRGISLGFRHARALRDTIRDVDLHDPGKLVAALDDVTEREFTPWYRSTVWLDRNNEARMLAAARMADQATPDPGWWNWQRLPAAGRDHMPVVVPRIMNAMATLTETPEAVLADPAIRELLDASDAPPPADQGPSRAELVAAAGGTG